MGIGRRTLLKAGGASTLLSLVRGARAQARGPIYIPAILPLSGPIAPIGEQVRLGAEITAAQINKAGGVLGRPIELIFRDDQNKPDVAAAVAREMIGSGHNLLIGGMISAPTFAVLPVVKQMNAVLFIVGAQSMAFTHEAFLRNVFRGSDNDYTRVRGLARLAAEKFPDVLNWGAMLLDNATYRDSYELFKKLATEYYSARGKKPTFSEPVIAAPSATDFRTQLSTLSSQSIDGLYTVGIAGAYGVTFWQQARPFGLAQKFKAIMDQSIDLAMAKALRQSLPRNAWTVTTWYPGLYNDNPLVRGFLEEHTARTKEPMPSGFVQYGHLPVAAYAEAVRAANGATDTEGIIRSLESVQIRSNKGNVSFRKEDHQVIGDVNFMSFAPSDREPGFTISGAEKINSSDLVEPSSPGVPFKA